MPRWCRCPGQTRKLIRTSPDAHVIQGQPVTEAQLNAADTILLDAKQRVLEELLEHAEELLPLDQVRQIAAEVAMALAASESGAVADRELERTQATSRGGCAGVFGPGRRRRAVVRGAGVGTGAAFRPARERSELRVRDGRAISGDPARRPVPTDVETDMPLVTAAWRILHAVHEEQAGDRQRRERQERRLAGLFVAVADEVHALKKLGERGSAPALLGAAARLEKALLEVNVDVLAPEGAPFEGRWWNCLRTPPSSREPI